MAYGCSRYRTTKYQKKKEKKTQSIRAYWEMLLKIVKIALLQFNNELSLWNVTFDNNYEWLNDFI